MTTKTVSLKFKYDGKTRHVDNVTFEDGIKMFIGFEVRKSGRFSNRIKRYDMMKIDSLEFVDPIVRY